jgi:hypothetical protein
MLGPSLPVSYTFQGNATIRSQQVCQASNHSIPMQIKEMRTPNNSLQPDILVIEIKESPGVVCRGFGASSIPLTFCNQYFDYKLFISNILQGHCSLSY